MVGRTEVLRYSLRRRGTSMIRGMMPDRADVEAQFEEIESIIATLSPIR